MSSGQNPATGTESAGTTPDTDCYVLGGGRVGAFVADRLQAAGHAVRLVDESHDPSEIPGLRGDPSDVRTLEDAGISGSSTVVVATPSDGRNLLIAQLVRARFDDARVVVLVNDPSRYDLLVDAGHEPICATTALSDAVVDNV